MEGASIEIPNQADNKKEAAMETRVENATMFFDQFMHVEKGEKVLFLSHEDKENTDPELIAALKESLAKKGIEYTELVANEETETEEVAKLLSEHKVIWSSCGWDQTDIDFYQLVDTIEEAGARMEDAAGLTAEALDADGMLSESKEALEERLERMHKVLKESVGFRITTSYGTDLTVGLRPDRDRRWAWATGEVDEGEWDNPGAEIFTTPDERKTEGVLVLPVLQDEITREQGVDEYVRVTFHEGKIVKIDGGESAEKLRTYLEEMSKEEDDPYSVIQCSELAFGGSKFARSKVADPSLSYEHHGVSVLEAEKRMGTMHVAIGSAQHDAEGASGEVESNVHVDFVLPRNELTVKAFYSDDDFRRQENGRKLIDEGRWNLIE